MTPGEFVGRAENSLAAAADDLKDAISLPGGDTERAALAIALGDLEHLQKRLSRIRKVIGVGGRAATP